MINFFQRTLRLTAPEDPLEGTLKLLVFSQAITINLTVTNDFGNEEETYATSMAINMIHLTAVVLGFSRGAFNWYFHDENQIINNPNP